MAEHDAARYASQARHLRRRAHASACPSRRGRSPAPIEMHADSATPLRSRCGDVLPAGLAVARTIPRFAARARNVGEIDRAAELRAQQEARMLSHDASPTFSL